jgi:tetratricopeptide (TPR) repeat protein
MRAFMILSYLSIFILSISLSAQSTKIDSLLQKLESVNEQDKASIYNQLAKIGSKNDPQKKIDYAMDALKFAREFEQKEEEFYALVHIGIGYSILSKNEKAVSTHRQALELANKIADKNLMGIAHSNIGIDYKYYGKLDKSLEHFLKSLSIKEEIMENSKNSYSERSIGNTLNNIGVIYDEMGEYDKALDYYYRALEIRNTTNDLNGKAATLNNIGIVFEEKGNYQEALKYYQMTVPLKEKIGNYRSISITFLNIGIVYIELGDYDKALEYHFKAQEHISKTNDVYSKANLSNSIADIYLEKDEPGKALPYIKDGLELAKQTDAPRILRDSYKFLSLYYNAVKDYQKAYETQSKYVTINDSLFSQELAGQVAEMQTKYETEKKEKEIEILARDKEIQSLKIKKQSVQLYLLIAFILLAGVISILIFSRFKLKQKQARIELEKKNLKTEQRLLRSQMNPHFIFNSMNSIQSYISGNDSFTAMTYLSKFAQLMRNILENSRKSFIVLSDEINTLELYIELERTRFKQKFDYQITIEPGLPVETAYIPPMLIQPFVENSIKHGLRNRTDKGLLEIEFRQNNQFIICIVTDNGVGRKNAMELDTGKDKSHQSLGMQVTRERLESLSKEKKIDLKFKITDLKDKKGKAEGTEVLVQIPYEME